MRVLRYMSETNDGSILLLSFMIYETAKNKNLIANPDVVFDNIVLCYKAIMRDGLSRINIGADGGAHRLHA